MEINSIYQLFLKCRGVSTDSRKLESGNLYISLKGPNFNGNSFAKEALDKGASYAIVDEKEYAINDSYILVDDCLDTLQELATHHRRNSKAKILALTGSNGKTTSKELIYSVLKSKLNTIATTGNLNNHIGVPLTLLSIQAETQIAIVEMGANHLREIEMLCNMAEPDYGYITNFGKAHLEGFINLQGVIKGKSELYKYLMGKSGLIFINNKDPKQIEITNNYSNKFTFGETESNANYSVKTVNPKISMSIEDVTINTNLFGEYNVENIASAICIGKYFGLSNLEIKKGVESYIPNNNRSQILEKGSNKIILDAYNANPTSMKLTLANFNEMDEKNKIVFVGDMYELGENSHEMHQDIVETIEKMNFDQSYLLGDLFSKTKFSSKIKAFSTLEDLNNSVKLKEISNATILIKGSRGMQLEKILDFLIS
ncbi:MAG: UDP-N-acetylmuramoyl-tripeptide--D-alanyl-D-alanine ligase [Bacteroidota bacterium]|nr:UDP-N-acetylmuramoyl-tripeptide--D-alanyl-D-alanine ligase [Bacteroidota bacterium]